MNTKTIQQEIENLRLLKSELKFESKGFGQLDVEHKTKVLASINAMIDKLYVKKTELEAS